MAIEQRFDNFTRLRYFNGLFLKEDDFVAEQAYHMGIRRYLNYLLFNPGRLYVDEADPLQVTVAGTTLSVTTGKAMLRDDVARIAYEVHLNTPQTFDLSGHGLSNDEVLTVTLEQDREDFDTGSGSPVAGDNRSIEQALVKVSFPGDPAVTAPHIVLATATYRASSNDFLVAVTSGRGGIRPEILSDGVLALLGGVVTPVGTTISVTGSLSLQVGGSVDLTAVVQLSDGTTRPPQAGDNLAWNNSNNAAATMTGAETSTVTITAVALGATTITATANGFPGSRTVTVGTTPDGIIVTPAGPLTIEIGKTATLTAELGAGGVPIRPLTGDDGLSWSSNVENVASVSGTNVATVTAVAQGSATITAAALGFTRDVGVTVPPPSVPAPVFRDPSLGDQFFPMAGPPGTLITIFCSNFFLGDAGLRNIRFGGRDVDPEDLALITQSPQGWMTNVTVPGEVSGDVLVEVTNESASVVSSQSFNVL